MRFLGGKVRLAKAIAALCEADRASDEPFWDLCCGAGNISAAVSSRGPRLAVDVVPCLVNLLRGVSTGTWQPPATVTAAEYTELQVRAAQEPESDDPLIAFAGFGCSYGGKWFAGFSAPGPCGACAVYDYAKGAATSLLRRARALKGVQFICADWTTLNEVSGVAYIDPEYAGTTGYSAAPRHDHDAFWRSADALSEKARRVFVSEYTAPQHWREVAAWPGYKPINKGQRIERLFTR